MSVWLSAVLIVGLSCQQQCSDEQIRPDLDRSFKAQALSFRVLADGLQPVRLVAAAGRLDVEGVGGNLRWAAQGERGAWLHHLEVQLRMHQLDPGGAVADVPSSRCRLRYLDEGRETEADFATTRVEVEALSYAAGQWTGELNIRCTKIRATRSDGKAYAAALPDRIDIQATAWARVR
ncbi:MAG: hypothetical protein AAFP04_08715 [Myxococcota bacterium]